MDERGIDGGEIIPSGNGLDARNHILVVNPWKLKIGGIIYNVHEWHLPIECKKAKLVLRPWPIYIRPIRIQYPLLRLD
jgi:hypothetical protein